MHDITIRKVNQGWIATVGCQTIVFTDKMKMAEAFCDYLQDEKAAQEKWLDAPQAAGLVAPPQYVEPTAAYPTEAQSGVAGSR